MSDQKKLYTICLEYVKTKNWHALEEILEGRFDELENDNKSFYWILSILAKIEIYREPPPPIIDLLRWSRGEARNPEIMIRIIQRLERNSLFCTEAVRLIAPYHEEALTQSLRVRLAIGLPLCTAWLSLAEKRKACQFLEQIKEESFIQTDTLTAVTLYKLAQVYALANMHEEAFALASIVETRHRLDPRSIGIASLAALRALTGDYRRASWLISNHIDTSSISALQDKGALESRLNLGIWGLQQGKTDLNTLSMYESRYLILPRQYPKWPFWEGSNSGRIVIYLEQGLGDEIFYLRFLKPFMEIYSAITVYLEVSKRLKPLIRASFPELEVFSAGDTLEVDKVDAVLPIGSLPFWLSRQGIDPAEAVRELTFSTDATKSAKVSKRCRVALVWRSTGNLFASVKTIGIDLVNHLLSLADDRFEFVSFQHGLSEDEKAMCRDAGIQILNDDVLLQDSGRLIEELSNCNMFIGISSSVAHCAASLGIRSLVLTNRSVSANYGWVIDEDSKPVWYGKHVRILACEHGDKWDSVLQKLVIDN